MGRPRSRGPASGEARPARRSLVELTEAARRAADDGLVPAGMIAAARDDAAPQVETARDQKAPDQKSVADEPAPAGGTRTAQRSAPGRVGAPDTTAEMAVRIAKDCQGSALDDIKAGLNAALDCAMEFASRRSVAEPASPQASNPGDDESPALGAAADFQAEAFELMRANVTSSLNYAWALLATKTSAEFVELSSAHAREQCELMLRQTRALRTFARVAGKRDSL